MLWESKQINEDISGMFGDDPDPMVMTERVGFERGRGGLHCAKGSNGQATKGRLV